MSSKFSQKKAVLLEARKLYKNFGGVGAASNVSFKVYTGHIQALIGPNGAGKTTTFNLISGTHLLDEGEIFLAGKRISGLPVHRIAALGVARTFQNLQIFHDMTVLENVLVGCYLRYRVGFGAAAIRWPGLASKEKRFQEEAMAYLAMVGLESRAASSAESLSYGQQRLVEIARALAVQPKLLLLDEPAAGLSGGARHEVGNGNCRPDHRPPIRGKDRRGHAG
jgi:branched-chain amino acid transport system ATP-binding protein